MKKSKPVHIGVFCTFSEQPIISIQHPAAKTALVVKMSRGAVFIIYSVLYQSL